MPFENFITENNFTDCSLLTEGASAFSYKAYDPTLQRNVFIKYYETDDEINESILSEPRKVVALFSDSENASSHIAIVYSANLKYQNNEKYIEIVTEYCDGKSLYSLIKRKVLYAKEALDFAKQILDGLYVLHKKNIVHRDIKPSNLVISNDKIKIIDLGGAKQIWNDKEYLTSRSKHSIFYRPPESFDPNNIYGKFSDIYQVGLILYEMLNGPIEEDVSHYIIAVQNKDY